MGLPAANQAPSGLCMTPGPTDVCKTPSPAGPVPIPYPNIAKCSDFNGIDKVKVKNKAVLHKGSKTSMSQGDNGGVAGGVKSSRFIADVVLKDGSPKCKA